MKFLFYFQSFKEKRSSSELIKRWLGQVLRNPYFCVYAPAPWAFLRFDNIFSRKSYCCFPFIKEKPIPSMIRGGDDRRLLFPSLHMIVCMLKCVFELKYACSNRLFIVLMWEEYNSMNREHILGYTVHCFMFYVLYIMISM